MSEVPDIAIHPAMEGDVAFLTEVLLSANVERYRHYPDWDASAFAGRARSSSLEQVRGQIEQSATSIIMVGGERAGRLRIVRTAKRLEIAGIQLLPAFQGRGVGSAVIRGLLREGHETGLPVTLEVEHDNPRARQLYQRLGFIPYEQGDGTTRMIAGRGSGDMGGRG